VIDLSEYDKEYLPGFYNRVIRYYYYLESGLNILNEFRNLFLGILGLYIALKLTNVMWMIVMAVPSLILLTIVGYFNVHRFSKVKEFLGVRFSSHYAIKSYDYNKEQVLLLREIKDLLKDRDLV
jgi:hypothetical protein